MMKLLRKLRRAVFGYKLSPEEKEAHRQEMVRRKAYLLGAGAGAAMRPDEDGVVRIEEISNGDDSVRDDAGA